MVGTGTVSAAPSQTDPVKEDRLRNRISNPPPFCTLEDCDDPYYARGYCLKHYTRDRRWGDVAVARNPERHPAQWLATTLREWDSDKCLEWPFALDDKGYPVRIKPKEQEARIRPAGLALILVGKPRPEPPNHFSLHSCDNPSCVNPAHLRWGNIQDNVADMVARGRQQRGESHSSRKLSEEVVRRIKVDHRPDQQIADDYGVSRATVSKIQCGRTWRHIL